MHMDISEGLALIKFLSQVDPQTILAISQHVLVEIHLHHHHMSSWMHMDLIFSLVQYLVF